VRLYKWDPKLKLWSTSRQDIWELASLSSFLQYSTKEERNAIIDKYKQRPFSKKSCGDEAWLQVCNPQQ